MSKQSKPEPKRNALDIQYLDKLAAFENLLKFKKTPHSNRLLTLPHGIVFVLCGNQGGKCQTYQTLIDTVDGPVSVGELYERGESFKVWAWDGSRPVIARANPPIKKPNPEPCVRINMSDGRWCEPAYNHRILTDDGWHFVSDLFDLPYPGPFESEFCRIPSTWEFYQSVHASGVQSSLKKELSYPDRCFSDFHQYGEQPLLGRGIGQSYFPSLAYGGQHIDFLCKRDAQASKHRDMARSFFDHPSSRDGAPPFEVPWIEFLNSIACNDPQLTECLPTSFLQQFSVGAYDFQSSTLHRHSLNQFCLARYSPAVQVCGNHIISHNSIGYQDVYDFEVDEYRNYFSGGLIHHNTANIAYDYVQRILGLHPIKDKNRLSKNIRCLSSTLPGSADENEQDNTQYLELKKLIPYEMILKDITARSKTMTVSSPVHGKSYVDFVSTKMDLQDTGRVQRCSLWADEEPPRPYWDEGRMRLHARGGDTRLSLTPINGLSWTYDDLYCRASYFWCSDAIVEALGKQKEKRVDSGSKNIAVVHMATDDNPTLTKESIERILGDIDDEDVYNLRRYGVFRQVSGKVHKAYNPRIQFISYDKYFPNGVPYEWTHARGIDYHESRIPWSVGWLSISPDDEWFLWKEFHPAIDGSRAYTTEEIARHMVRNSADYYYVANLIDPLANKKQANTGFSVTEDLNRIFETIRLDEGLGTACHWEGWDTKNTKGRDEVRKRFKNAALVGRPFNNTVRKHGILKKLPTLWICDTCPNFNKSIQRWSYDEWATTQTKAVNDPKVTPQQRWSHDCMVLECLAKSDKIRFAATWRQPYEANNMQYSQTGRPMA